MLTTFRFVFYCVCLFLATTSAPGAEPLDEPVPSALFDYARRPEPAFSWKLVHNLNLDEGRVYDVDLTSQQWQGITWNHTLQIHEPKVIDHPRHVLLFVTGGRNGRRPGVGEMAMGRQLARLTRARVAMLFQVPNQPLLGDRVEDDLITETWLRYLETGDETWPLLLPMVKSAVKAMDAIEAVARQQWDGSVDGFVVTGASKRGWTSWLTPVVDKRVIGTAPLVIDVLNFRPQMDHQLATWGRYSEQIIDYTSKGLVKEGEETERERHLRRMMDPYTYRERLMLPKLMVNGTNDPYWVVDAMKLYWHDLAGPKYVLQVPNAGHGLEGGRGLAMSTIAAFFQHTATRTPLPALSWEHTDSPDGVILKIRSSHQPKSARLWVAHSDTKDFRRSKWEANPLQEDGGVYSGAVGKPDHGHAVHYGELQFESNGLPFSLCTLVRRD
jgi:PhoPQ-activated pathogenicity-related protein